MICREILESPVILPCNDTICKKHVLNQSNDVIRCGKCGVEHRIPINGFQPALALQEIIEAEIGHLDFGSVYNDAKKSCQSFEEALRDFEVLLKDPYAYIHERISELRNAVQLKGEELKQIIDQTMKKQFDRLEDYERQSKMHISSNEFNEELKKLGDELKLAQSNLDSWLTSLDK